MQILHASLSDEDYGILYNFVHDGIDNRAASMLLIEQLGPEEYLFTSATQQRLDFATLLIYESGRELP